MTVEIAYIDESYDDSVFAMSALMIRVGKWREALDHLRALRATWKADYGIFSTKELHATEFVAGRGRIADRVIPKGLRAQLFKDFLTHLTTIPGIAIIGGAWPRPGIAQVHAHTKAFSRIQDRLQRRVRDTGYMLRIVDEGREIELLRVARKIGQFNAVGSRFGSWEDGSSYKNIPTDRLVEDPVFKSSKQSMFLQAVDFVAFALLKSEVPPTPHIAAHGLNDCYRLLEPILVTRASPGDPKRLGIVRS